ncbi:hypothetical protein LY28_02137 [Ruminiclostridium sufflavum DSM 19573]|uniref:Uncharacterized protein n=1 Tax=Ruminiclostridium sufflavum DSM 19573 TaxID=1121337 RepID=A0A318XLT6_9FIRM|nr:hypothetical protein [Ruminiclostridium sufflavum]PYG87467.1 hypothetical protein LY28_02137 [Ruminiclostridium sufflavum DSM 19573]
MFVQRLKLIVPVDKTVDAILLDSGEHDKIECYQGNKAVNNFGLTVHGSGTWVKGTIKGTLEAYDYKAVYEVYNLKESESANYWFVSYRQDKSHDELKKTFEDSHKVNLNYDLSFMIQGNDYDINSVFICYEVIRLVVNGVTKDFVVTNPSSSSAMSPDGSAYPGGFKPVE